MTRFHRLAVGVGLVCALGIGLTVLRANEDAAAPTQEEKLTLLQSRLESLEKRIAVLEADREQATRQASAQDNGPTPLLPVPQSKPQARIWLLKHIPK